MSIYFTKMHGLGNDFIILDKIRQDFNLSSADIVQFARRDIGIGFDQCLIIEQDPSQQADFFCRIFNANGQEVGQCGNGARCCARFVYYYGLTKQKTITIRTITTTMKLTIKADDTVVMQIDKPSLEPATIPLLAPQAAFYMIPLANGIKHKIHALNVGNPHAIILVENTDIAEVADVGEQISTHQLFPQQTNVGFMQIKNKNYIYLRVYERGCGETKACGSGAIAAAAVGRLYYDLDSAITVNLPGGELLVEWPDLNGAIFLRGPASFVYEGKLM